MRRVGCLLLLVLSGGCRSAYYDACGIGGICPEGLLCAAPGSIDICTTPCVTTDDCAAEHGADSFCSLGGVCLERCRTDADCPPTAYCDVSTQTCVR